MAVASLGNKPECNVLNSAPELSSLTMCLMCVFSSASQTCASVYWPHGSKFDLNTKNRDTLYQSVIAGLGTCMSELWLWCKQYLTEPRKRTGSWGMTDSLLLKTSRPTWAMLTPSTMMDPPLSSTSLKSAAPSEDLPEDKIRIPEGKVFTLLDQC